MFGEVDDSEATARSAMQDFLERLRVHLWRLDAYATAADDSFDELPYLADEQAQWD